MEYIVCDTPATLAALKGPDLLLVERLAPWQGVAFWGAGDLFAAGFLFGLARGVGHQNAGRLGALAAAEVIQHIGARPQVSLKDLARQNGLPV